MAAAEQQAPILSHRASARLAGNCSNGTGGAVEPVLELESPQLGAVASNNSSEHTLLAKQNHPYRPCVAVRPAEERDSPDDQARRDNTKTCAKGGKRPIQDTNWTRHPRNHVSLGKSVATVQKIALVATPVKDTKGGWVYVPTTGKGAVGNTAGTGRASYVAARAPLPNCRESGWSCLWAPPTRSDHRRTSP